MATFITNFLTHPLRQSSYSAIYGSVFMRRIKYRNGLYLPQNINIYNSTYINLCQAYLNFFFKAKKLL